MNLQFSNKKFKKCFRVRKQKEFRCFNCQSYQLIERGLIVESEPELLIFLRDQNYYRISGYIYKYKKESTEEFEELDFKNLRKIYKIDSELRRIILTLLESVELKLRSIIAYVLGKNYGPLCYEVESNFQIIIDKKGKSEYKNFKNAKKIAMNRSVNKEITKHHRKYYGNKLPIWALVEILTFDNLCHIFKMMHVLDQKEVCSFFSEIDNIIMTNWLFALLNVRNQCAHYNRIFDLSNLDEIAIHNDYFHFKINPNKLFAHLLPAKYILGRNEVWYIFIAEINSLLKDNCITHRDISFPKNWERILKKPIK